MEQQFYTILTKVGKAKIANSNVLNKKLNLTKFQVGDGGGAYYNPTEDQTKLKNKVWEGNINSIRVDKDNPSWVVIEVVIPSNEGGFMIREAGIMDDEGNLIAVGKYPETFKPHIDNGSSKDLFIRMILEVSNTQNVTLKVDPTIIMATKKDIEVVESKLKSIENTVLELKNNPIVRGVIPSGFIKFNDIDFAYGSSNQNKIKLTNEGIALVNGWKVTIPDGTIIELGNPPTEGEREDLVFLECWLDKTTRELKYRIRVVDGADFDNLKDGLGILGSSNNWRGVVAIGGNTNQIVLPPPISNANCNTYLYWEPSRRVMASSGPHGVILNDFGVYVAGQGTQQDKDILKTFDGFVYAIPMFQIWRRNSSPFSDVNPNGSRNSYNIKVRFNELISKNMTATFNIPKTTYDILQVGDKLNPGNYEVTIMSKNGNDNITIKHTGNIGYTFTTTTDYTLSLAIDNSDRPDYLFCNTIDKSDIIDLRHTVLRHDYEQMLAENFEKALRGELQTNVYNDMMKTYHGIRKTPIDANTIFYCSFDNTVVPEVGASYITPINIANTQAFQGYRNCPTGLGLGLNPISTGVGAFEFPTIPLTKESTFTVDVGVFLTDNTPSLNTSVIFSVGFGSYYSYTGNNGMTFRGLKVGYNHLRLVYKPGSTKTYLNGKLVADSPFREEFDHHGMSIPDMFRLHVLCNSNNDYRLKSPWVLFDLSISNVDRGDVFQTLPKDFIDGYAKIASAFSEQRKCFSDALSSEYKSHVLKSAAPKTYPKGITVTQSSSNWASNDTIKIKGLAGEIIMGVVDTDTTIARITGNDTNDPIHSLYVDDVSKIVVGDTLSFLNADGRIQGIITVNSIDTITKKLTTTVSQFDSTLINNGWYYLVENTPSSSSPITKFKKADGTIIQANMVWSGLGTNEATGTIQTTTELTNQDLQIEYSLVEVEGQGPFSDLPYQMLGAEINGQKYVVNNIPRITDDYRGKVTGSLLENPHIAKYTISPNIPSNPNVGITEFVNDYVNMAYPDNNLGSISPGAVKDSSTYMIMSFKVIDSYERKYGPIPSIDKVKWCRDNINSIQLSFAGFATSVDNKLFISPWCDSNNTWRPYDGWGSSGLSTDTTPKTKYIWIGPSNYTEARVPAMIDNNGYIHFMAYTSPSDGTTPSRIIFDYVSIDITLKKPSDEYDLLTPISPRRDAGVSNIIAVRKETNEVRNLYGPTLDLNSKFATYSNYVPYQGTALLPKQGVYPLTDWVVIASTMGTGDYNITAVSRAKFYKGIYGLPLYQKSDLYKFKCELMDVNGDKVPITKINYHNTSLGQYAMALNSPIGGNLLNDKYYRGYKLDNFMGFGDEYNGVYGIAADVNIKGNYYLVAARLVVDNQGNILMLLARSNGNILYNDGAQGSSDTFYLKNRPMIGGV